MGPPKPTAKQELVPQAGAGFQWERETITLEVKKRKEQACPDESFFQNRVSVKGKGYKHTWEMSRKEPLRPRAELGPLSAWLGQARRTLLKRNAGILWPETLLPAFSYKDLDCLFFFFFF